MSVSVEGVVRQRRLPEAMSGLAERISLSSRYYIKNNNSSEPLLTDSLAPELARESKVQLEELSAHTLAAQLTLQVMCIIDYFVAISSLPICGTAGLCRLRVDRSHRVH